MGITNEIASFVKHAAFDQIPSQSITTIKKAFLDTIGVAIASRNETVCEQVMEYVRAEQAKPISTIWGSNLKTSASLAALVNGTMAHALDYDDVSHAAHGHTSAVLVPAIFSVVEETNSTGKDAILAYFVGFEVMAYLGKLLGDQHFNIGWHATATIGAFGSAVAAGKLYQLSEAELETALGIAASLSCGTQGNFGTLVKNVHPGIAAKSGIMAAKFSRTGMSANRAIFDNPRSYLDLYRKTAAAFDGKIGGTIELEKTGLTIKQYPCCSMTHRAADGMFHLVKKHEIEPAMIEEINVEAPSGSFVATPYDRPNTGLESKHSIEYVMASILLDGQLVLDTFTDQMVNRDEAQSLLKKVKKVELAAEEARTSVTVTVQLKNKEQYSTTIQYPKGSYQNPLTTEELTLKFTNCVDKEMSKEQIQKSIELFTSLECLESLEPIFCAISNR